MHIEDSPLPAWEIEKKKLRQQSLSVCVKAIPLIQIIRMFCKQYGVIECKEILRQFCDMYDIKDLCITDNQNLVNFFNLVFALRDGALIFKADNNFYPRDPQPLCYSDIKSFISA